MVGFTKGRNGNGALPQLRMCQHTDMLKELLITLAQGLVENKDAVKVSVDAPDAEGTTVYHLSVAEDDMGRVIGKQGRIAKAIRVVMIEHAASFDFIVTTSEFEALVLECSQIKLHSPKYNILLKDDKGYCYIRVGRGPYARISAELQKADDGAEWIGPYMVKQIAAEGRDVREFIPASIYEKVMERLYRPAKP